MEKMYHDRVISTDWKVLCEVFAWKHKEKDSSYYKVIFELKENNW